MKALELTARYSLMPNYLSYCGESNFYGVLEKYLGHRTKKEEKLLAAALKHFKGNYPYLKTISKANGKKPFDLEVIEAFWIGNSLLERVPVKAIKNMIIEDFYKKSGMDKERAFAAVKNLPKRILIHHSFNSLYLKFVDNKVRRTVAMFDKCRIGWGKILEINKQSVVLLYWPITISKGKYAIGKPVKRKFLRRVGDIPFLKGAKVGDYASTHWGLAVEKLSKKRLERLIKYTKVNIAAINNGN